MCQHMVKAPTSKGVHFSHKMVMNVSRPKRDSGINGTPRRVSVHIVKLAGTLIFGSLLGYWLPIRAKTILARESVGKLSFNSLFMHGQIKAFRFTSTLFSAINI